jgi:F-type H+-transporting ATPase subunit gamma
MSQFIKLKQRIKTVETIKKTTHAMRLIAMSGHSRLKHAKDVLDSYQQSLARFAQAIGVNGDEVKTTESNTKILVVCIGSQKGLSGSFNSNLFNFIKKHAELTQHDTIIIGKQLIDLAKPLFHSIVEEIPEITQANYSGIATKLKSYIEEKGYTSIFFVSNTAPSFFIQKPMIKKITVGSSIQTTQTDVLFEQDPQALSGQFLSLKLLTEIMYVLYESLLAEQAARFVSMDNATRNAENMLKTMKLDYNKLRQASITRELTDLIGSRLTD